MSVAASTSDPIESVVDQLAPAPAAPPRDQWDDVIDAVVPPKTPKPQPVNVAGVPGTTSTTSGIVAITPQRQTTDPRVQAAMEDQRQIATQEAVKRGGFSGVISNTFANTGGKAVADAGHIIKAIAEGHSTLPDIMSTPMPEDAGEGPQALQSIAAESYKQKPVTAGLTDLSTGLTVGNLDPRNLAAMIASGLPAGATMESSSVQRTLGAVEARYGPRIAGAVESILHGSMAGASFGAARGAMDQDATAGSIAKQVGFGALLGGGLGAAVHTGKAVLSKEVPSAEGVRSDAGQVQESGPAIEGGKDQSGQDLQQPAQGPPLAPGQEATQPVLDGAAPEGVAPAQPPNVVAIRAELDRARAAMDDAKRAMEPTGQPKDIGDLAGKFQLATEEWKKVHSRYQQALLGAGLPLDTTVPPTMTSKAPVAEPTEPPPIPPDLKSLSRPDLNKLAEAHGVDSSKVREWVEKRLVAKAEPRPSQAEVQAAPTEEVGNGKAADAVKEKQGLTYPIQDPPEYGDSNYKQTGGIIKTMTPDEFLAKTFRPLKIDEASRDNIDDLKRHIKSGRLLDPPTLYTKDGAVVDHDGRHRAIAAKELGITELPVLVQPKEPGEQSAQSRPANDQQTTSSPDTTGIAHRVSEARGLDIRRGEGTTGEESVARGRELLKGGADPEATLKEAEADPKRLSDAVAIARAQQETLAKAANTAADAHGTVSPEYKAAAKADADWLQRIKVLATESHRAMVGHQGETEIDTGTYHGLAREYRGKTGKDFTPEQAATAKEHVGKVQEATKADTEARQRLLDHVSKGEPDLSPQAKSLADRIVAKLDKAAADALARFKARQASPRLHTGLPADDLADLSIYGAAKVAKGFVKFADWSVEMVKDIGESIKPHLKDIWNAADKHLDKAVEEGGKDAPAIKAKIGKKPEVDLAGHPPGSKMTTERVKALWQKAKDYIDGGAHNLDDIVDKLSTDTGLSKDDIRKGLTQPKSAKKLTDDMYKAQADRRAVVNAAKQWVQNAATPGWIKAVKGIPGAFFSAKVFGHSTVGMVTHAGPVLAGSPPGSAAFRSYFKNFAKQYKFVWDKAYHEAAMQDLQRRPNYATAKRAGLANEAEAPVGEYQTAAQKLFRKLGIPGGANGFDALKIMRQDLFDQAWDKLPESIKTPEMAKSIAMTANHLTGFGENVAGRAGPLSKAANVLLFAPKLEGSRWGLVAGDPIKAAKTFANWKNATPEAKYAAVAEVKQKATAAAVYLTYLAANQALLSAAGSDQKINFTDPSRSDWLSFKAAGHNFGIVGPLLGSVRFMIDLAKYPFDSAKELRGDTPVDKAGERVMKYLRGKLSPFGQPVVDAYAGSDFQKRPMPWSDKPVPKYLQEEGVGPITWGEYLVKTFVPLPAEEAITEAWKSQGIDGDTAKAIIKGIVVGAVSGGTGARVSEDYPERQAPASPTPKTNPYAPGAAKARKGSPYHP